MKNKHTIRTLAVLLAVMLCMTAFSTVAFASSEDTVPTSEAQTEPTDSADITGDDLSELISALFGSMLGGAEKSGKTGTVTTNGGKLNVRTGAGLDNYAFTQLPNRIRKRTHAGQDDSIRRLDFGNIICDLRVCPDEFQRALQGKQIPHTVINNRNHQSTPFVDGISSA